MSKLSFLLLICSISIVISTQLRPVDISLLNFHVNLLDSQVQDVGWCGNDKESESVVLLTTEGTVYHSNDYITFENISEKLNTLAVTHLKDGTQNVGEVVKLIKASKNINTGVLLGSGPVSWITSDCGKSFRAFSNNKQKIKQLRLHPTNPNWILALTDNACDPKSNSPCFSFQKLWLSQNGGVIWTLVAKYVFKFEWGYFEEAVQAGIDSRRVFWIQEQGNNQNQNRNGLDINRFLYLSDDFFETKIKLEGGANSFQLNQDFLYILSLKSKNSQHVDLKVANSRKKNLKFFPVQLGEELKNHQFTLLETGEFQVFLNVNHLSQYSPMGSLYASDGTGMRFSLSLLGNVRNEEGEADFEMMKGIQGVFMANTYSDTQRKRHESSLSSNQDDQDQLDSSSNSGSSLSQKQSKKSPTIKDLATDKIQTKITFDNGASWQRIPTPEISGDNRQVQCTQDCYLNIHATSDKRFNTFYSSSSAIGLVLANGNVGNFLAHSTTIVNTYLSRDGGVSWKQIKEGAYVFELGDHGSIIVIARDKDFRPTDKIEFSFDQGESWYNVIISDTKIEIENIITEPSNTGVKFLVLAKTLPDKEGKQTGIVISLDFAPLLTNRCNNPQSPGSDDSDYELFTLHSQNSTQCLLGKTVTYSRRKANSICYSGEDFERIETVSYCQCTEEDWECEMGYTRDKDNKCQQDGSLTPEEYLNVIPDICLSYYSINHGYRRVPGNQCQGGVDYTGEWKRCPGAEIGYWDITHNLVYILALGGIIFAIIKYKEQLLSLFGSLNLTNLFNKSKSYKYTGFDDSNELKSDTVGGKIKKLFKSGDKKEEKKSKKSNYLEVNDEEERGFSSSSNDTRQYFSDIDYQEDLDTHNSRVDHGI